MNVFFKKKKKKLSMCFAGSLGKALLCLRFPDLTDNPASEK